jgi:hypothetical protein
LNIKYSLYIDIHHDFLKGINKYLYVSCFSKCYNGWINESHDSLNEVMVEQNSCPRDESLLKFFNFGTLRCGSKLQMTNLLKMIVTRG